MSFGAWLWKNRHDNDDTLLLYTVANNIGPDWPIASSSQRDYERLIKRAAPSVDQANALQALDGTAVHIVIFVRVPKFQAGSTDQLV